MNKKILENVSMGRTWTTYIGSLEGALKKGGLWNGETYQLMGMTGMAFHFIVHKTACPSSVTVYDWDDIHFTMADRIGVYSRFLSSMKNFNTGKLMVEDAVREIKGSIDNGIPVVVWAPTPILEFGIIRGYDDGDKVFDVIDCVNPDPDPLMYENLGKSQVSILYIQRFISRIDVDKEKTYRDSLKYGLDHWNKPIEQGSDYASGKYAYENLLNTLTKGDYDGFGLSYILTVYAESKTVIPKYLNDIRKMSKELEIDEKIITLFEKISEKFKIMSNLVPFKGSGISDVDKNNITEVMTLARECRDLEDEAMEGIGKSLGV